MREKLYDSIKYIIMTGIFLLILIIANLGTIIQSRHVKEYTVVVRQTDSKYGDTGILSILSTKKEKWMVFAEDVETGELYEFENTDNLFRLKWNSSSLQNQLEEGETYRIKTCGWRIQFLSWYPNILEIEEVRDV